MTPVDGVALALVDLLCRAAERDRKTVIRFFRLLNVQDPDALIRLVARIVRPAVPPDADDPGAAADHAARRALAAAGMLPPEYHTSDLPPTEPRWPGDAVDLFHGRKGRPSLRDRLGRNPYPDRIRAYSLAGGTQEELARACNVKPGTVRAWASGINVPSPPNAEKLDRALAERGV